MLKHERILIVDDEEVMREFLLEVFTDYQPIGAENGQQALELLKGEDISLVISDFKMPGMDGLELLHRIKQYNTSIKVVIITGYASFTTASNCMQAGAADFIKKPFSISQIKKVVKKLFETQGYDV